MKMCRLNVKKAGYTPVMLTALVDSNEKVDLSPLIRLFKGADLDLQSKKVNRPKANPKKGMSAKSKANQKRVC